MATAGGKLFLLTRYYQLGCLEKRYFDGERYTQPYSADDRLIAGKILYADFVRWKTAVHITPDYGAVKVDASYNSNKGMALGYCAERFRRALRVISKPYMPVIYKIVLEELDIKAPKNFGARERLYFNDEIKGLLCRGLDELCHFYQDKNIKPEA